MVTEEMLKKSAVVAESVLISQAAPESEETHEFSEKFERKIKKLIWRIRDPFGYYATRAIPAIVCVLAILISSFFVKDAPDIQYGKYKRISFDRETLGEELAHIDESTAVVNNAKETFPTQLPIYEITPHNITQQEFDAIVDALNLPGNAVDLEFEGNRFFYS